MEAAASVISFSSCVSRSDPLLLYTSTNQIHRPSIFFSVSAVQTEERPQTDKSSHRNPNKNNSNTTILTATTTFPPATTTTPTTTTTTTTRSRRGSHAPITPTRQLPATVCNVLDDLINRFMDPPSVLRPSVDPRRVLTGNFAPVDDLPPTPCLQVRGTIPECIAGGVYIRNGPNPQYLPRGPYHLFDGDGMLHALRLPDDRSPSHEATLCSRFVRTNKFLVERDAGGPVFPNFFAAFHGPAGIARGAVTAARVLTGQMDPTRGIGLANTSLLFFAGRLYALGESDLPYAIHFDPSAGDIATLGRCDFGGRLLMGMTAHPKLDPATGELFAFRYGPMPPYLTYFRFDPAGNKLPDVPIFSLRQPSFLHDFAITERYAVFGDIQIVMKPMDMVLAGGSPVGLDPTKVPRVGVLPRYAESEAEIRWYEVPGFNMVHAVNAWDEDDGDTLVLVAPNVLSVEHALERTELVHSCVEMVRIDLRTGTVRRTPLSAGNLDFPVIHPGYVGRKNRYAYLGMGDPMPKIGGVVKLDFEQLERGKADCTVAKRIYGPGCFGGEPFFVPKDTSSSTSSEEDEGYLVSYVHDEVKEESKLVVMDAQSADLEIVAEVVLPRRVPYGFHGIFLTREQLQAQHPPPLQSSRLD